MENITFDRLDLRLINFALMYTFWMNQAHYSPQTHEAELIVRRKVSKLLLDLED